MRKKKNSIDWNRGEEECETRKKVSLTNQFNHSNTTLRFIENFSKSSSYNIDIGSLRYPLCMPGDLS